jgi:hypothetical protein
MGRARMTRYGWVMLIATGALVLGRAAQCHGATDWEGEDAPSLEELIRDIVAGKVKHKGKLELSPDEIADIAAYWGQVEKKGARGSKK